MKWTWLSFGMALLAAGWAGCSGSSKAGSDVQVDARTDLASDAVGADTLTDWRPSDTGNDLLGDTMADLPTDTPELDAADDTHGDTKPPPDTLEDVAPDVCQPDCAGKQCGDDGCGGSCGSCIDGNPCTSDTCVNGTCATGPNPQVWFYEDFEDGGEGWTLGSEWEIGDAHASDGCLLGQDPSHDHSPTGADTVAGTVIGGCTSTAPHSWSCLTSPAIDLSAATGSLELTFWRYLTSDSSPHMQNKLEAWDGVDWVPLWITEDTVGLADSGWTKQTFDITSFQSAEFRARWCFQVGGGGAFPSAGWSLDDVAVGRPECDDGNPCTEDDVCDGLSCFGFLKECSDGNSCTTDSCDSTTGACVHEALPDSTVCVASNPCAGVGLCDAGVCVSQHDPVIFFYEDFVDPDLGWSWGPEWEIGAAAASSTCQNGQDPAKDHSPTDANYLAGTVIGGCASTAVHDWSCLSSPTVSLAGVEGPVELSFWRYLVSESMPYMQSSLEVWTGAIWLSIWGSGSSPTVNDTGWTKQTFDITLYKSMAFRVRWCFKVGNAGGVPVPGWSLDDIIIGRSDCDDGDPCTTDDFCNGTACVGTPVSPCIM